MTVPNLCEAETYCRPLSQQQIDWFLSRGVPVMALARSWDGAFSAVRAADVVRLDGGRFEFAAMMAGRASDPAIVFDALDRFGEPADVIAWRGDWLASWLGRVAMLGEEQLGTFRIAAALDVLPDALAWLQGGRRGVVIVDEAKAAGALRPVHMVAASLEQGRRLRRLCEAPPLRISIRTPAESREAA